MSTFPIPVAPLYGALYFSSVMCTAFYGVMCMQSFFYFIHYQGDPLRTKIFVAFLWAVNTLHEGMTISGIYKYIMAGLADPSSFVDAIPELVVQLLLTIPVALPAQGFFVYRIYIFSNESLVAPLIWLPLAIYQLVAAILYVVNTLYTANGSIHVVPLSTLGDKFLTAISVSYCSVAAGVDVLIAIFLTLLLIRRRVSVTFKSTARILERLTVFAINSGIWTAVFSLLAAILVHVMSSNLIYAVFFIPLCSIYCNTVLANLNARIYIQRDANNVDNVDTDILMISMPGLGSSTGTALCSGLGSSDGSGLGMASIKFPDPDSTVDTGVWKSTEVMTFSDANADGSQRSDRARMEEEV